MLKMGAHIIDNKRQKVVFRVFAAGRNKVSLILNKGDQVQVLPMIQEGPSVYMKEAEGQGLNLLYKFRLDGEGDFPDPYSNFQPFGVHGYSQVIDHTVYTWRDRDWKGRNLNELIIMEIHVGTFTPEGTFRAAVEKLDYLSDLGITAVEVMPVAQTPGRWNWGYDGVNLFSVNHNYGTPDDLKYLVDRCHQKGLAVILDVVYNHFGPEGNYLPVYGPVFTHKHQTPWGAAVNYDDDGSQFVREMVLENVRYWLDEFHFDGLRLDAVHAIKDDSNPHILQEISLTVEDLAAKLGRKLFVMAESDENNVELISPIKDDGYGMDAQWMDDFHHVIHTALTGEDKGYYMDYGRFSDFEKVYKNYLYTGQYSRYWKKKRGTDGLQRPGSQFVACIQNHDQVGNRAYGDRLSALVKLPYLKAAAGLLFFSAYLPLLFMGEEYGEEKPFLFFTDYQDPALQKAVSQGRKEEFKDFGWSQVPDPQDPNTFFLSKPTPQDCWSGQNHCMLRFYRDLIKLRVSHPVLKKLNKEALEVKADPIGKLIKIIRSDSNQKLIGLFNLGVEKVILEEKPGRQIFNSEWRIYGGREEGDSLELLPGQMLILESWLF